jgi:hypothetical protein
MSAFRVETQAPERLPWAENEGPGSSAGFGAQVGLPMKEMAFDLAKADLSVAETTLQELDEAWRDSSLA